MTKENKNNDNELIGDDPMLVKSVDLMMDPDLSDESPSVKEVQEVKVEKLDDQAKSLPPLDIFQKVQSAPLLVKKKEELHKLNIKINEAKTDFIAQPVEVEVSKTDLAHSAASENRPIKYNPAYPDDYNDPKTAKAIDDIVAQESDQVLASNDERLEEIENSVPNKNHKAWLNLFFWLMVFLLCLIAIGITAYYVNPAVYKPLSRLNWHAIKGHI